MELIVVETETLKKIISEEVETKIRLIFRELGFINKEIKGVENAPEWLSLEEAKRILPFKSRRRWKLLRDNGEIDFAMFGRSFIYNRQSLIDYI